MPGKITKHGARYRFKSGNDWITCDTREDAEAAWQQLALEQSRRRKAAEVERRGGITIAAMCERWFERRRGYMSRASVDEYEMTIRLYIRPTIGERDATVVTAGEIKRDCYERLAYRAAKRSHMTLDQAFRMALKNGWVTRPDGNPIAGESPSRAASVDYNGRRDNDDVLPVEDHIVPAVDEVEKLHVEAAGRGDQRWWLYLRLASATGGRPGEVCALQRKHVLETERTIAIVQSADPRSGTVKGLKRPWSRRLLRFDDNSLFQDILPHLPQDSESYLFPAQPRWGHSAPKMPCWDNTSVSRRLRRARARAGIERPFTPHGFRHYVATHLLRETGDAVAVARWLGHKNPELVLKLYGNHVDDDVMRSLGAIAATLGRGGWDTMRPFTAGVTGRAAEPV